MRTVLIAALLGLAACSRDEPAAPTAPAEPSPIPSKPPLVAPPETPGPLAFVDAVGAERLRLDCRAGQFHVVVPGFEPVASEDRLTIGAGDEAFAHAADLQVPGPGVAANGAIDADLLGRLARGEPVRAVYGSQSVGPLTASGPEALRAFAARCGRLQGG